MKYKHLKIVEHDYMNRAIACLRETIASWLERSPCAEQLLKALIKVGEEKLCHDLKQSLIQGDHRAAG